MLGFSTLSLIVLKLYFKIKTIMGDRHSFRNQRFEICNYLNHSFENEVSKDVLTGLAARQKFIPSKYFYDKRGSILFEEIFKQPEYYLTRTELSILNKFLGEIMESFQGGDLVELGSGANWKISKLL